MSYILEALKKSDEERNRGSAPGLQTVHTAAVAHPSKKRTGWICLLAFALLLNAGLLIWWLGPWRSAEQQTVQSSAQQPPQPAAAQTAKAVANQPVGAGGAGEPAVTPGRRPSRHAGREPQPARMQSKPSPTLEPAGEPDGKMNAPAAVAPAPVQQPARPAAREAAAGAREAKSAAAVEPSKDKDVKPSAAAATKPAAKPEAVAPAAPNPPAQQQARATAEAPPSKPEAANVEAAPVDAEAALRQLPNLQSLPPAIRKEIPSITLSLLVYSSNPVDRMVNINGQMTREGQEVVPGLVLEQITKEGAVFNYKGTRFQKGAF